LLANRIGKKPRCNLQTLEKKSSENTFKNDTWSKKIEEKTNLILEKI